MQDNMKLKYLWIQFIKFGLVGISNTLISLAIYYACISIGFHYLVANTIGFMVSVTNAYYWNSRYVFKVKGKKWFFAYIKVVTSYTFSFLLSTILITVLVDGLKLSEYIAPIITLAITIPINFFMNKKWAFRD